MRVLKTLLLGCLGAAALVSSAAAITLVPVPDVPNSKKTTVFGINDSNVVAGSFIGQDKVEHAFFGTLDGNYTIFDAGAGGSEARGINNAGFVVGFFDSQGGSTSDQTIFVRKPGGKLLTATDFAGRAQSINNSNQIVGSYWDFIDFEAVAFVGHNTKYKHDVHIPAEHQASQGEGISDKGDVVGSFFQPPTHGYIAKGNDLTVVDYPSAKSIGTSLEGINSNGLVAGQWFDRKSRPHSFLLNAVTGTFTDIEVAGAKKISAWNLNNLGAVPVSTDIGSFIWCLNDSACPAGGKAVKVAVHLAAKPFPHLTCGRTCKIPTAKVERN
jgi:hypothetical protein